MLWVVAVLFFGGVLTSYHQPFNLPSEGILSLSALKETSGLRVIHFVSGGCRCSQAVMKHLLHRLPIAGVSEEVVVIDGDNAELAGTNAILTQLQQAGFVVTRIASASIPSNLSIFGVPLLVVASTRGSILYKGGYGPRGDEDPMIIRKINAGFSPKMLPVIGCATGLRVRRSSDPFHLKYH